jgi:hypothetical protein
MVATAGFRIFGDPLSSIGHAIVVLPYGMAATLVALLTAVLFYAGRRGGTSGAVRGLQFGLLMGVFVACIHSISNLVTMNMDTKLGLEIAASNAIGWVLAGLVIGLVYKPLAP